MAGSPPLMSAATQSVTQAPTLLQEDLSGGVRLDRPAGGLTHCPCCSVPLFLSSEGTTKPPPPRLFAGDKDVEGSLEALPRFSALSSWYHYSRDHQVRRPLLGSWSPRNTLPSGPWPCAPIQPASPQGRPSLPPPLPSLPGLSSELLRPLDANLRPSQGA